MVGRILIAMIGLVLSTVAQAASEPGCVERVVVQGSVVLDRAHGQRRVGHVARLSAQSSFRLASVSKQFTAAAVLTLVESGQLSLDARLADLLPGWSAYAQTITVRHLLTHTSGLPDYEVLMDEAAAHGGPVYTSTHQIDDAAVIRLLASTNGPLFPAGSRWAYSNSGYVVLGQIVAAVSGETFGHFLESQVFVPNGLYHTHLRTVGGVALEQRAYGHRQDLLTGVWHVSDQSATSATGGDGGIYSTVDDMARWLQAIDRGETVIGRWASTVFATTRLADGTETHWPAEPDEDNLDPGGTVQYGLGWFLDPAFGATRRWHFGTTEGFRTAIDWFPKRNIVSVVLCNRMDVDARDRALENVRRFFGP